MTHDLSTEREKKRKKQQSAFVPVFGLILLVVFGAFSWVLAPTIYPMVENMGLQFPVEWTDPMRYGVIALVIFIVLFAIGMMLIAAFAGAPSSSMDSRMTAKELRKQGKVGTSSRKRH